MKTEHKKPKRFSAVIPPDVDSRIVRMYGAEAWRQRALKWAFYAAIEALDEACENGIKVDLGDPTFQAVACQRVFVQAPKNQGLTRTGPSDVFSTYAQLVSSLLTKKQRVELAGRWRAMSVERGWAEAEKDVPVDAVTEAAIEDVLRRASSA